MSTSAAKQALVTNLLNVDGSLFGGYLADQALTFAAMTMQR
jgi:hypothetical protein